MTFTQAGALVWGIAITMAGCGGERSTTVTPGGAPDEAAVQIISRSLAPSLDRSTDGLVEVPLAGGGVGVDLRGRFQSAAIAKIGPDGRVLTDCVDSVEDAARFLRATTPPPETRSDR
jgi:hypothetical protein